jgi:hypothetical protein
MTDERQSYMFIYIYNLNVGLPIRAPKEMSQSPRLINKQN